MALFTNLFTYQPFKALYVFGALFSTLGKLPFWILKSAFVRQHPTWSFRQALAIRMLRTFISTFSAIRARTPLPLTPGKEGPRFIVIKKKDEHSAKFKGPMLANAATVQPVDIGATWYPSPLPAAQVTDATKVILHIHGGAYIMADGRTAATGYLASTLLRHTPATHLLAPQYRLSSLPASPTSNPFPAALQDALTAYLYLLHDLHIPATNIVLSGDSAGANCAVALLRYIAEHGAELDIPAPGAALLWSPWVNPTEADNSFVRTNPHFATDYIVPAFTSWGVCAFAGQDAPLEGPSGIAGNPYANAKVGGFRTQVPLYVNVGSAEVLYFDGVDWVEMMRKEGNDVSLDVTEGACHDLFLVAGLMGMEGKARDMAKNAGEWLKGLK